MAFSGFDFEIAMGIAMVAMFAILIGELAGHSFLDRLKKKQAYVNEQGVMEVYPDPTTPLSFTIEGNMHAFDHAQILNRRDTGWTAKLFLYTAGGTPRTETYNSDEVLPNIEDPVRLFGSAIKDFKIVKGGLQNALKNELDMTKEELSRAETWISNLMEELRQGNVSHQELEKRWAQERGTWRRSESRKGAYPEMPQQPQPQQQQTQQAGTGGGGYGV